MQFVENVDVGEMVEALDHARDTPKAHQQALGRQVARGYIDRPHR